MPAQIGRFSRVALIGVCADRGSWGVCDGPLSGITPQKRTSCPLTPQSSTVVALHAREIWMARRKLTVDRHEEIKRRLADGRSVREIARRLRWR
jgi:hypothetical protein